MCTYKHAMYSYNLAILGYKSYMFCMCVVRLSKWSASHVSSCYLQHLVMTLISVQVSFTSSTS